MHTGKTVDIWGSKPVMAGSWTGKPPDYCLLYLKQPPGRACSCCLPGPPPASAGGPGHLGTAPAESNAARKQKRNPPIAVKLCHRFSPMNSEPIFSIWIHV